MTGNVPWLREQGSFGELFFSAKRQAIEHFASEKGKARSKAAQRRPAQTERNERIFSAKRQAVWFGTRSVPNRKCSRRRATDTRCRALVRSEETCQVPRKRDRKKGTPAPAGHRNRGRHGAVRVPVHGYQTRVTFYDPDPPRMGRGQPLSDVGRQKQDKGHCDE